MVRVSQPPASTSSGLPAEDEAFRDLIDPRMKWSRRRARAVVALREGFQRRVGVPLEEWMFRRWSEARVGGDLAQRRGLPRRSVERRLNDALILWVDPRQLIRDVNAKGVGDKKPSSSAFLWKGDWDRSRGDLRWGSRYRFISDLDIHRHDLTQTERFRQYHSRLASGQPWSSYRQGLLLDSDERILAYLRTYLGFLDDMGRQGFDAQLGKDDLGVAVTREGRLLKINRGLHRLAMAQRLGLPSVPVRVRAVHHQWWHEVVGEARGERALDRVREALGHCVPESDPGDLDPVGALEAFEWPAPRILASQTSASQTSAPPLS